MAERVFLMCEDIMVALLYGVLIGFESDGKEDMPQAFLDAANEPMNEDRSNYLDPREWMEKRLKKHPQVEMDFFRGGPQSEICRYFIYTNRYVQFADSEPTEVPKDPDVYKDANKLLKAAMKELGVDATNRRIGWWLVAHCPF